MASYNLLNEASESNNNWRFKVMIDRIYSYSIFGNGPYWSYVLADETGSKIELVITPAHGNIYSGLEKHEGKWIEVNKPTVRRKSNAFGPTKSPFILTITSETGIKLIEAINSKHFMEFLKISQIFNTTINPKVAIDTMGMICKTKPIQVYPQNPSQTKIEFHIKDAMDNKIKCVATGIHAHDFSKKFSRCRGGDVIVVLKPWRVVPYFDERDDPTWLRTEKGLSDVLFNLDMEEVEDFRDEFEPYEPFAAKHRAIVP